MSRFKNVRGKGRKDAEIDRLREENETLKQDAAAAPQAAPQAEPDAPARPSRLRIRALAYQRYLGEGGAELNRCIRNAGLKAEAFRSQVQAWAQGGAGAFGPEITAYEDRMNCSLQSRMLKQREEWIERCRMEIEADIEAGENPQAEPERPQAAPKGPVSMPPESAWQQMEQWLAAPEGPVPFCFPQVMAYVQAQDGNYENCPPQIKQVAEQMHALGKQLAEERDRLWPQA